MSHAHAHAHHSGLAGRADADAKRLAPALALIVAFMVVEVVAGVLSGSLALLSDAAHMLTDAGALGLALVAARLARRPAEGALTYGLGRAEVLSAQVNGATLVALALVVGVEGVRRLADPPEIDGATVVAVALAGIVVNLAATRMVGGDGHRSLNVEGAYRHLLTDLAAFVATAVAGALVLAWGWDRADPVASLLVAALMAHSAWGLLKASGRVVLEAAPEGVDPARVGRAMAAHPGVVEVHDLHVWEVSTGFPALSAHVVVRPGEDCHRVRRELAGKLRDSFGLEHTTLQVDHATVPRLVTIDGLEP